MPITCEALDKEIAARKLGPMTWQAIKQLSCLLELRAKLGREYAAPHQLTDEDLRAWVSRMENADGSVGAHWTEAQTNSIAQAIDVAFGEVSAAEFWAAMNMMYSDYAPAGLKYGVDRPEFYADLAKEFLFDKDGPGPSAKLAAYYNAVVK